CAAETASAGRVLDVLQAPETTPDPEHPAADPPAADPAVGGPGGSAVDVRVEAPGFAPLDVPAGALHVVDTDRRSAATLLAALSGRDRSEGRRVGGRGRDRWRAGG